MKSHRIKAVVLRHAYEFRRNFDRITETLYWPVLDIIMWGFFTLYLSRSNHLQPNAVSFLLGAIILWDLFRSFQRDMAVGFLAELWSRNLVNMFSTPLSITEYMTGLIVVNLGKALIGMAAGSLIAWLCYSYNILPMLPMMLPFMFNLIFFAFTIGIVTTALIFRYTTRVQGLAWSIVGVLMPFSCVFYPISLLPPFLQAVAWCLPTAHAFEGMRQSITGHGFSLQHLEWCVALNLFYFVFALGFFKKLFESARAHGLLVKVE